MVLEYERGDFLGRFSLMLAVGKKLVAVAGCLFGVVI